MIKTELSHLNKIGNTLSIAAIPYGYFISEELKYNSPRILGYNASVGTSLVDITETSENINIPTAATPMEMDSTSDNDIAEGIGVQVVEIIGLDSNYNEISEQVIMNGTTAVATVNSYLRINNIHSVKVGDNGSAVGTITIQSIGGATEYARISVDNNTMFQALFTVPNNYNAYIVGWTAGATSKDALIVLRTTMNWNDSDNIPGLFSSKDIMVASSSTTYREFQIPIKCSPKCDIKVSGQAILAGAKVSASIALWYEKLP